MKLFSTLFVFILSLNICYGQLSGTYNAAQSAFEDGNYTKAIELFSEIINVESADEHFSALYSRAYSYYFQENYSLAKADLKKALKINSVHPDYKLIKGCSYWLFSNIISKKKSKHKSLKLLKKASLYLQTSLLYSSIGYEEIQLKKYEDALNSLNTSIKLDENNAYAYSNRALAYLKLNKLDLALNDINISLKLDDENSYAYKHRALIFIALKDYESACNDLNKAIEDESEMIGTKNHMNEIENLKKKYCQNPL